MDTAVTGKKGTGKSLICVGKMQDALREGRRVATNLDLFMEHLCMPNSRKTVMRLPDRPTRADLDALGYGQACLDGLSREDLRNGKFPDNFEEENNGVLVLDECSHFFNARSYQDKDRQACLDWITEARKMGWDIYYILQGLKQIDVQIRETQIEYHAVSMRTDKWPIPVVTQLSALFLGEKKAIRFPKMHINITKHGTARDAMVVFRKFYRSKDLYKAYNTLQRFSPPLTDEQWKEKRSDYPVGLHTVLSAWHIHGRYLPQPTRFQPTDLFIVPAGLLIWTLCRIFRHPVPTKPKTALALSRVSG